MEMDFPHWVEPKHPETLTSPPPPPPLTQMTRLQCSRLTIEIPRCMSPHIFSYVHIGFCTVNFLRAWIMYDRPFDPHQQTRIIKSDPTVFVNIVYVCYNM